MSLTPENRNRIVKDALDLAFKKKVPSASDLLVDKAKQSTLSVQQSITPILKAGGWKDPNALRQTVCKLYLEQFCKYSKDELENLLTMIHTEIMMENVSKSPWGDPKPDLLS